MRHGRERTGQLSQVQLPPQLQVPEVEHPQSPIVTFVRNGIDLSDSIVCLVEWSSWLFRSSVVVGLIACLVVLKE